MREVVPRKCVRIVDLKKKKNIKSRTRQEPNIQMNSRARFIIKYSLLEYESD